MVLSKFLFRLCLFSQRFSDWARECTSSAECSGLQFGDTRWCCWAW